MKVSEYEPCYLDKGVLYFLRGWPKLDYLNMQDAKRASEAGLMATAEVLTNVGWRLKEIVDAQSFNFFTLRDVLGMWSTEDLAERKPGCMAFLALFGLDPNHEDVRRYIARRFKGQEPVRMTATGQHAGHQGIKYALRDLALALHENAVARKLFP